MAAGTGAGADDDWRSIVGSEANLRQYLGSEGFRYCLNKTPEELEKEGACVRYSAGIRVVGMGMGTGAGGRRFLSEIGRHRFVNHHRTPTPHVPSPPNQTNTPGDYSLFEKMFGATSNNEARLAAKSYGRALTIDKYDPAKVRTGRKPVVGF